MALFVASRIAGLARDIAISYRFGTSAEYDAYVAAFNIPDFLFNVIAGGALTSALLPTFTSLLAHNRQGDAWRLASGIINLALVLVTAGAGIAFIFATPLAEATIARGFSPEQRSLTVNLMRVMLITPVVFGVSASVQGILNSFRHFTTPALAPIVYNLAIIFGALFLAPTFGVYGLAYGVVAGALLHLVVQLPVLFRLGAEFFATLGWRDENVRHVGALMLPRMLGLATVQINFLVNTVLASSLGEGGVSSLRYGFALMLLPEAIVAQAIATTVFPALSEFVARKDWEGLSRLFSNAFRATLFLALPASVGLIVLREPIIQLLYQRGEFDARSTDQVAWVLQFYALGLFAHAGLEIVARVFYALHDTATPVKIGLGAMVINIVLSLALIGPLQQGGLALANSLATILELAVLMYTIRRRMGRIDGTRIAKSLVRTTLASLLMGLLVYLMVVNLHLAAWLAALSGIVIGGAIYLAAAWLLKSEEIAFGWQLVTGK